MIQMFRVRIDRKLLSQATKVAEEIGTTPGEVVRMLFKYMVIHRTIPFPLQADIQEDEIRDILGPIERRIKLCDEF